MKNLDAESKKLSIQNKVLQRYLKDYCSYEEEYLKEAEKLEQMKASNQSEYKIKQQQQVVNETKELIPNLKLKIIA